MFIASPGKAYLASMGVDLAVFRKAVAYHEAAHVAVALHFGAVVERVGLLPLTRGNSTARAEWKAGQAGLMEVFTAIAAGPASDEMMNPIFKLPEELLSNVAEQEKGTFISTMRQAARHIKTNAQQEDGLWLDYLRRAREVLEIPVIHSFHSVLADAVIKASLEGQDEVSQAEIGAVWQQVRSVG